MENSMHSQKDSPAYFLRWSVSKVADKLYAVAATVDGKEYDFVGNFKSVREAQQAGRRMPKTWFIIWWPAADWLLSKSR